MYDVRHESESAPVECNFNCLLRTEGLVRVTDSYVSLHCKCGNISETVQDGVVTADQ